VKLDCNDVLVMGGLTLLCCALWMVNPATSLATGGAAMMIIAYLRSLSS